MHRKQGALKHLPTIAEGKAKKRRKKKEKGKGKVSESRCSVWGALSADCSFPECCHKSIRSESQFYPYLSTTKGLNLIFSISSPHDLKELD